MSIILENSNKNELFAIGNNRRGNGGLDDMGGNMVTTQQVAFGTDVDFSSLSTELPSHYAVGLADITTVPTEFNWRYDTEKGGFISKPGNQGLCGSCWAISAAGIIGDNFVVSGLNTDDKGNKFVPNISTTWILVNYGQQQCGGGNPGVAFQQIASSVGHKFGGLVTNHCLDYSWCSANDLCNGDAKRHFQTNPHDLNKLIPVKAGCYYADEKFLFKLYKQPNSVAIGMKHKNGPPIQEKDWPQYKLDIKKHIMTKGPVLGGFLVFDNFMSGTFTKGKANKGIYLENGTYPGLPNTRKPKGGNPTDKDNFKGSHAVAIIGWGSEDDVETSPGKKETVEYWYCRNSWTENWGDDGYFKMAMYPYNKISQFDKQVTIYNTREGTKQAGGIVSINVTQKPELVKMNQVTLPEGHRENIKLEKDKSYYTGNVVQDKPGPAPVKPPKHHGKSQKTIFLAGIIFVVILMGITIPLYFSRDKQTKNKYIIPFVITEAILVLGMCVLVYETIAN